MLKSPIACLPAILLHFMNRPTGEADCIYEANLKSNLTRRRTPFWAGPAPGKFIQECYEEPSKLDELIKGRLRRTMHQRLWHLPPRTIPQALLRILISLHINFPVGALPTTWVVLPQQLKWSWQIYGGPIFFSLVVPQHPPLYFLAYFPYSSEWQRRCSPRQI